MLICIRVIRDNLSCRVTRVSTNALSTKLYRRFNLRGLTFRCDERLPRGPARPGRAWRARGLEFDVRLEKLYHWQHTRRTIILAMTFIGSVYASCNLLPTDFIGLAALCSWKPYVCARIHTEVALVPKESARFCRPCAPYVCAHFLALSGERIFAHNVHVGGLGKRAKIESRPAAILSRQECTESDYRDAIVFIAAITSSQPTAALQIRIRLLSARVSAKIRVSDVTHIS